MALQNYTVSASFPHSHDVQYWSGSVCTGYSGSPGLTLDTKRFYVFIKSTDKKSFVPGTQRLKFKALDVQREDIQPLTVWVSELISAQCARSNYVTSVIPMGYTRVSHVSETTRQGGACAPAVIARAKLGCLSKAADQRANLSIAIAELNSTVSMISGIARRVAKAIVLTKKGHLINAYRTLVPTASHKDAKRHLARHRRKAQKADPVAYANREVWENDWLMMQYGVFPALKDAQGLAEMAAQRFFDKPKIYSVTASSVLMDNLAATYGYQPELLRGHETAYAGYSLSSGGGQSINFIGDTFFSVKSKAKLVVQVSSSTLVDLNQMLGNLPELAYELVPLSFVADWFVNLGEYIRLSSALSGLVVLDGFVATEQVLLATVRPDVQQSGVTLDGQAGAGTHRTVRYTRTIWNGELPSLQPGALLNGSGVLSKLLSAASLIRQRAR